MIKNKIGEELRYDGKRYYIGQVVYANESSDYAGLIGSIKEIRTDKDKDSDNIAPDIYVSFDAPVGDNVRIYEERFSRLYGEKKTIDEISFDLVIMAPEMLTTVTEIFEQIVKRAHEKLYVVIEEWAVDYDPGLKIYGAFNYNEAKRCLRELKKKERHDGCVCDWKDGGAKLQEDISKDSYAAYIDGEYSSNHYSLIIEEINTKESLKWDR